MSPQSRACGKVLVALGANFPGPWGSPRQTIAQALSAIERANARLVAVSPLYETAAVGSARQPHYLNAVALLDTTLPPHALLRALKAIERRAGRRGGKPWGPRTLDIDIVDYAGLVRHWHSGRAVVAAPGVRPLTLPHPLAHERPFVLKPLFDLVPDWRHPVLKRSARDLWSRVSHRREGRVLQRADGPG